VQQLFYGRVRTCQRVLVLMLLMVLWVLMLGRAMAGWRDRLDGWQLVVDGGAKRVVGARGR
jgi:hypothetical protein